MANPRSFERRRAKKWSLLSDDARTKALLGPLLACTNAAWRAAALYVLSSRQPELSIPLFDKALGDSNAWVRRAAIQGAARARSERTALEPRLAPLLADPAPQVAALAAAALLEPEILHGGNLQFHFTAFRFESFNEHLRSYSYSDEQRPLVPLEGKPPYLDQARRRLADADNESAPIFMLLLAQYGQFDGLDRLIAGRAEDASKGDRELEESILTAIALSRDVKYLSYLRSAARSTKSSWELRKVLRALKGMPGPEARALRLEINRLMRNSE